MSMSPLLQLPAEVRNQVWEYAVLVEKPTKIEKKIRQHTSSQLASSASKFETQLYNADNVNVGSASGLASGFAVTSTCRQMYIEATPIYYSKNWFHIILSPGAKGKEDIDQIHDFMHAIGPQNALNVQRICLTLGLSGIYVSGSGAFVSLLNDDSHICWQRDFVALAIHYQ